MSSTCNLCGGENSLILETAEDGVSAMRCASCGLIYLHPFPRVNGANHYNGEYYRPWREEQVRERVTLWRKRADLLDTFARPGNLLDVGCGDGSFILAARERGWRVAGTEVSKWAAQMLRESRGLDIFEGDLTQIETRESQFDALTMWHVLEHMDCPLQNLMRARELLIKNGVIVVAVPNSGFTLFRLAYPMARLRRLRYYTPGERELHLHHFTMDTLHTMLEKAGFRVIFEGIDESALRPANIILEKVSKVIRRLTGACWSEALLVVAAKAT